jgi:hypothetical protein
MLGSGSGGGRSWAVQSPTGPSRFRLDSPVGVLARTADVAEGCRRSADLDDASGRGAGAPAFGVGCADEDLGSPRGHQPLLDGGVELAAAWRRRGRRSGLGPEGGEGVGRFWFVEDDERLAALVAGELDEGGMADADVVREP